MVETVSNVADVEARTTRSGDWVITGNGTFFVPGRRRGDKTQAAKIFFTRANRPGNCS